MFVCKKSNKIYIIDLLKDIILIETYFTIIKIRFKFRCLVSFLIYSKLSNILFCVGFFCSTFVLDFVSLIFSQMWMIFLVVIFSFHVFFLLIFFYIYIYYSVLKMNLNCFSAVLQCLSNETGNHFVQ